MGTKYCSKCKQSKVLSEFHKNRQAKDGLQYRCKTCSKPSGSVAGQTKKNSTKESVRIRARAIKEKRLLAVVKSFSKGQRPLQVDNRLKFNGHF